MIVYLFWGVVGIIGGAFCAILDEGQRMDVDQKLKVQFLSLIVSYVVGATIFGNEPEGGVWILGLAIQVACAEITYRLLRRFSPLR